MKLLNQKEASVLLNIPRPTLCNNIKRLKIPSDGGTSGRPLFKESTLLKYFPIVERPLDSTTIAITNQKGGEAKTTLTQYLGQALSIVGKKTLLIDMDPQASLTSNYMTQPDSSISDLMGLTGTKKTIKEVMYKIDDNLSILPSNIHLSAFTQIQKIKDYKKLNRIVDQVRSEFEFILIDCPPSLGPLLDNALAASDKVLIPVQCREYSLLGIDLLTDSISDIREDLNPRLELLGAVLSIYNKREIMSEKEEEIKSHFHVMKTKILKRASIPQNQATKENYFETKPKDAKMFLDLAQEIIGMVE